MISKLVVDEMKSRGRKSGCESWVNRILKKCENVFIAVLGCQLHIPG